MAKKILILEDEKDIGRIYVKFLKDRGYDPVLASDGNEGLNLLKDMTPDLILLDLGMPQMNGIEFYRYICDYYGKPKYPVLILTGRMDLESLFKDFQVEGFIIKPFAPTKLLEEVNIIFNTQERKRQLESARRIMIVDNNMAAAEDISKVLTEDGFNTSTAHSGTSAIEKIVENPPDVAVINLSLADIPGDLVILRLQGMAKTRHVKSVLYVSKEVSMHHVVRDQFSIKSGVKVMCEYENPAELLDPVRKVAAEIESSNS